MFKNIATITTRINELVQWPRGDVTNYDLYVTHYRGAHKLATDCFESLTEAQARELIDNWYNVEHGDTTALRDGKTIYYFSEKRPLRLIDGERLIR